MHRPRTPAHVHRLASLPGRLLASLGMLVAAVSGAQDLLIDEDFGAGLGAMSASTVCGTGASWTYIDTCAESGGAPSPPGHARFGAIGDCSDYSDGDVTARLSTPSLDTADCKQLTLHFHYNLDVSEDSSADRARVLVETGDASVVHLANNGPNLPGEANCSGTSQPLLDQELIDDAVWRERRIDLTPFADDGPLRVWFEGETVTAAANDGAGFLVDDVEIWCSRQGDDFQVSAALARPEIAQRPNGEFAVVWSRLVDLTRGISVRRYAKDGALVGSEISVTGLLASLPDEPNVAINDGGDFLVVWYSGLPGRRIDARLYSSAGAPLSSEQQLNAYTTLGSLIDTDVWAAPDGGFWAVWSGFGSGATDSDGGSVQLRRVDASGAPLFTQETQVNAATSGNQRRARLDGMADGRFVVVWDSESSSGTDQDGKSVQLRQFDSNGAQVSGEIQVNAYTVGDQIFADVAMADDGGMVVVWQSAGSLGDDDDDNSVQTRRFLSSGAAAGPQIQLNLYTTGFQNGPQIAEAEDGTFLVVWDSSTGGSDKDIVARWLDPDGIPVDSEFVVNTYTPGMQYAATLAEELGSNPAIAWASGSSPGDSTGGAIVARQSFLIFVDGFESGDTTAWSQTTP